MSKLENKSLKLKKSFVLLITMFMVILFGIYSLTILENNTFSDNLNKLKYLHLQASVHLEYINQFVKKSTPDEISNFQLNDDRFKTSIVMKLDGNITTYYINIKTIDDTPVRLSQTVVK